jgi:competence protein ComFC
MGWLIEALFPRLCAGCGKTGGYVCERCEVGLWEEEQICPACRRNSRYGERHHYCKNEYLEGLICLWAYEGWAKRLIKQAKYRFYYDCLEEILTKGWQSGRREEWNKLEHFLIEKQPVIVPVPLDEKRFKWRGFNQAEIIAQQWSRVWGLPYQRCLTKVKETGQQAGKAKGERLVNLHGAFTTSGKPGEAVVLVDDVWTTGATLQECAEVLRRAGVKQVWGVVLAR